MTVCEHVVEKVEPMDSLDNVDLDVAEILENISRSKNSFYLPVTLWVHGKKVQTEALVDSGATTIFVNHTIVEKHNLVTNTLANPYNVINADGTSNKQGLIDKSVHALLKIGEHSSTHRLLVADLGNKDLIIGMSYLRRHNPEIDWAKGEWRFTRCPENCDPRVRKNVSVAEEEAIPLPLQPSDRLVTPLDEIGEECPSNPFVSWIPTQNPDDQSIAELYAEIFDKDLEDLDEDTRHWHKLVPKHYHDFGEVFSKTKSERMPVRKPYDHGIEFVEGASLPKPAKLYPMSPIERKALNDWVDEELRKGYIVKSKSPIAAPVFFVKKKDGSLRLVQDYRRLNDITVKNRYPIPRINDLIDALSKASIFTKIDLRWGYNNVRIKEGDEWKTAFITHRGLFEAKVMYFGFSNAPATFQAMMNEILGDLIIEGSVIVYLDDILIFNNDLKEHRRIVREVLRRLQDNDLFAKPEKCLFEVDRLEYLGVIISKGKVEMDASKVAGVLEWPQPTKVKQVQAFLGLANFYRRFIKDFAKVAKPLHTLTKKDQPWVWGEEQETAFKTLKKAFTTAPILRIPDDENPFRLETDASEFATGAVLSQLDPTDKLWHPVAFYSKSLNSAERNYEIYDKEMLAIIRALSEYRQHLEGHPIPVEIWSDHENLTYFKATQKLTRRQARWALYLTRFNFVLKHKPGKSMLVADPLSRRPDHEEGVKLDNRDQILLKPEFFAIQALESSHDTPINDDQLLREVKEALLQDSITEKYKDLLQSGPREFKKSLQDWNFENGLLLYRGKIYIPKSKDDHLRRRLVQMHHDLPSAGHPGRWKTYELISRNYWWPGMTTFVKKYVMGCDICQRMKNRPQKPYGPLQPNEVPEGPWEIITVDLIVHLPESNGFNAICVVVDRFSKRAHFFAITDEFSAKDLAKLLYDRVWVQHGLPKQIISDRGSQFAAELFQEWCKLLGIVSTMTTAYHPQTDGQTERVNQTLEQFLRCYIDYQNDDWSELLSSAEFAYNNAAHESTKHSPFFIEYGRHPRAGPTLVKEVSRTDMDDIMWNRSQAQEQAKAALKLAAERMKWYYDQGTQYAPFKEGDLVLLDLRDYQKVARKLNARYAGPFKVLKKLSEVTFLLEWPENMTKIHPVFHASKLVRYIKPQIPGQVAPPPPPVNIEGHEEFEVEKILSSQRQGRKLFYLVRWKGYGPQSDTWEPVSGLKNARELIKEYHKSHPHAVRTLTSDESSPTIKLLQHDTTLRIRTTNGQELKPRADEASFNIVAPQDFIIPAHTRTTIPTGIQVTFPHGTHGLITMPPSSLEVDIINSIVHNGELKVTLSNQTSKEVIIPNTSIIATLVIIRSVTCNIEKI